MRRQLNDAKIDPTQCQFKMIAVGPLFEEQASMELHKGVRDKVAFIEKAVAEHIRNEGHQVIGKHQSPKHQQPDPTLLSYVISQVEELLAP